MGTGTTRSSGQDATASLALQEAGHSVPPLNPHRAPSLPAELPLQQSTSAAAAAAASPMRAACRPCRGRDSASLPVPGTRGTGSCWFTMAQQSGHSSLNRAANARLPTCGPAGRAGRRSGQALARSGVAGLGQRMNTIATCTCTSTWLSSMPATLQRPQYNREANNARRARQGSEKAKQRTRGAPNV